MKRQIFRQVALERLSSPEQLDQLMRVTTPRGWLALLALIGLIVTVVGWSFSDTIPTEVVGKGILLRGGRVLSVVSSTPGQVDAVLVRVGDIVEQGQAIARVKPGVLANGDAGIAQPVEVRSPHTGRIVEIAVAQGSVVGTGTAIASLEDTTKPLEAVIYMPPENGKNIQVGMEVQISPSHVRREEYGFIRGNVESVATFPSTFQSMMLVLANEQLVQEFLAGGTPIEIRIALVPDATTPSGYRWSSSNGSPVVINSGTLCLATVTLDEQRPINLVLPIR
jgi:multidrug resistance efflux pump